MGGNWICNVRQGGSEGDKNFKFVEIIILPFLYPQKENFNITVPFTKMFFRQSRQS